MPATEDASAACSEIRPDYTRPSKLTAAAASPQSEGDKVPVHLLWSLFTWPLCCSFNTSPGRGDKLKQICLGMFFIIFRW